MSAQDLEQRARELLRSSGWKEGYALVHSIDAIRAIVAALRQQPDVIAEADRLLSTIDNAGKVDSVVARALTYLRPHLEAGTFSAPDWAIQLASILTGGDGCGTPIQPAPVVFRNGGNSEADFIAHHADACTACGGSGHKSDQQPAPVVDDAMVERACRNRYPDWDVYGDGGRKVRADDMRADLTAALALAQGVQS